MIRTPADLSQLLPIGRAKAAEIATIAGKYQSMATLERDGIVLNLKSMIGLLSQSIPKDGSMTLVADGVGEKEAMVIDTGNTMGGGDDPIALLKKYPGRTPVLHLKGYGQEKDYETPVWESELDMEKLMTIALDECGAETIIIEFGKRGDYEPFQRAEESLIWLKALLKKMGRI